MAKFWANNQGVIITLLPTWEAEQQQPATPSGGVYSLQFDELTNSAVISAFDANGNQFSMPGGTLTQTVGGVAASVTINPAGAFYSSFLNYAALLSKLAGGQYVPTTQEMQQIAAAAFRAAGFAGV